MVEPAQMWAHHLSVAVFQETLVSSFPSSKLAYIRVPTQLGNREKLGNCIRVVPGLELFGNFTGWLGLIPSGREFQENG